jgi:hypothetical protein
MEGVVVTAKKDGSTIAVSVVSDKAGHYSFPWRDLNPVTTRSKFARSATIWRAAAVRM